MEDTVDTAFSPYFDAWGADFVTIPQSSYKQFAAPAGWLQFVMDRAILGATDTLALPPVDTFFDNSGVNTGAPHMAPFPTRAGDGKSVNDFATVVVYAFGVCMTLGFMWPFSRLVRSLVEEKETRTKEALGMLGVSSGYFLFSWVLFYTLSLLPVMLLGTWTSGASFLPGSSGLLVFCLFFFFLVNVLLWAVICSTLFDRAQTAGVVSPFVLFVSLFPWFGVFSPARAAVTKYAAALMPTVAIQARVGRMARGNQRH